VRPYRVKESPVQIECKVRQVIETGSGGGAANLVICEILVMHISEDILDDHKMIDQQKIRLVGRLGGNYYVKGFGDALFEVEKPLAKTGIGIDALPDKIKHSKKLTGNDLGRIGNLEALPSSTELEEFKDQLEVQGIYDDPSSFSEKIYKMARKFLDEGQVSEALTALMLLDEG
jgi:hypothetical protein